MQDSAPTFEEVFPNPIFEDAEQEKRVREMFRGELAKHGYVDKDEYAKDLLKHFRGAAWKRDMAEVAEIVKHGSAEEMANFLGRDRKFRAQAHAYFLRLRLPSLKDLDEEDILTP